MGLSSNRRHVRHLNVEARGVKSASLERACLPPRVSSSPSERTFVDFTCLSSFPRRVSARSTVRKQGRAGYMTRHDDTQLHIGSSVANGDKARGSRPVIRLVSGHARADRSSLEPAKSEGQRLPQQCEVSFCGGRVRARLHKSCETNAGNF